MTTLSLPTAGSIKSVDVPTTCLPQDLGDGITVLPSYLPVPGMGVLPAHAFLIDGPEPMLVDAGPGGGEHDFQTALRSVVDPAALRWLWLTHTDPDHVGSLGWLLDMAPDLRIVTTFLAVGKLGMQMAVPMDRLYWLNPGEQATLNGRHLEAVRPPSFDAPETVAFHDLSSGTFFAADSFGALLHRGAADASEIDPAELTEQMVLWSTIDAPWVTHTDRAHLGVALREVQRRAPRRVLSSHLPPAHGLTDALVANLALVPDAEPFVGPDQQALEQMLASMAVPAS